MARETQERITQRPSAGPAQQPEQLRVVAQPVNQHVAPSVDNDLTGLLDGLKAFNPALTSFLDTQTQIGARNAAQEGHNAAALELDPRKALESPATAPSSVDPALAPGFSNAYQEAIGTQLGLKSRTELFSQYEQQKNAEGFNTEQFLRDFTQKEFAGVTDPTILVHATRVYKEGIYQLREDTRKRELTALQDSAKMAITGSLDGLILPGMSPDQVHAVVQEQWLPTAKATKLFTQPELSKMYVDRLHVISERLGGRPELFDSTYIKDASGRAVADQPELQQHIEQYKRQAEAQRDKRILERDAESQARKRIELERNIANVTDEQIWEQFHPKFGIFRADDEVFAFMNRREKTRQDQAGQVMNIDLIRNGQGWRIAKKEEQESAFNSLTDAYADQIVAAAVSPDPAAAPQASIAMQQIIGIHAQSGLDVPNKKLKNLFSGLAAEVPKEGVPPSSKFTAAVEMYKAMPPHLQALYTEGDTQKLLSNYLYDVNDRVDPTTAYQNAFRSISPEAQKLAEERLKNPEVQAKIAKYVAGEAVGFWRNIAAKVVPFDEALGIYPDNESVVGAAAQIEAKRFLEKNPNASDSRLKAHLQEFAAANFTYEPTSNKLVRIPPGTDPRKAQEAFKLYTEELQKQYGKDVDVELVYKQNGTYQVLSLRDKHSYGEVTLPKLLKNLDDSKALVQETGEAAQFAALKQKLLSGTASTGDLVANQTLITKVRSIGIWSAEMERKAMILRRDEALRKRSGLFKDAPEAATGELTKAPPRGAPQVMGEVAKKFMTQGDLTAALITMGEGVVNRVYNDPAKGRNIGMGYNIDANERTLAEDFRRAGIPAESIEAIKAGKAELTQDQSMRLLQVVIPRYQKIAQEGLEKLHPGEWEKLPPNQKAALTDLAYQVGSVDKFPKALQSLISGNTEQAGADMTVTYKKRETGERVVDSRRNNLRYQMLTKPLGFAGITDYATRLPRNTLEAQSKG